MAFAAVECACCSSQYDVALDYRVLISGCLDGRWLLKRRVWPGNVKFLRWMYFVSVCKST